MSFVLKENNVQLAISGGWNPNLFGKLTGTSYPAEVTQDYIWEHDDYWLGWEDDPLPTPPTPEEITLQKDAENEQLRLEAYRTESDPLFFKWQRGEVEKQVWLNKVTEIKEKYN
jgi:hypothetical protein